MAGVPEDSSAEDDHLLGPEHIFFTPEGGDAYLRDLPNAELHKLDSGHFAVEDSLDYIAANMRRFYAEEVKGPVLRGQAVGNADRG